MNLDLSFEHMLLLFSEQTGIFWISFYFILFLKVKLILFPRNNSQLTQRRELASDSEVHQWRLWDFLLWTVFHILVLLFTNKEPLTSSLNHLISEPPRSFLLLCLALPNSISYANSPLSSDSNFWVLVFILFSTKKEGFLSSFLVLGCDVFSGFSMNIILNSCLLCWVVLCCIQRGVSIRMQADGEDYELKQTKDLAAAKKRWEALVFLHYFLLWTELFTSIALMGCE